MRAQAVIFDQDEQYPAGTDFRGEKGAGMKIGTCAKLLLAVVPLLTGCAGFWDSSSSSSFALTNSGNMTVSPGSTGTSTITVTPSSSFTGTVALTCAVTTTPTSATSPTTCDLSSSSITFSTTTAQTSTLTATTTASTTTGAYDIAVTGTSGTITSTTTVCAEVTSSTDTCSATAGASGIFYVLNVETLQIVAYYVNAAGTLTQIATYTTPATPITLTVAPSNNFLYLSTYSGIYVYKISSDGTLAIQNSKNVISSDEPFAMQVDSTNKWLVEVVSGAGVVSAIPLDSSTGLYTSATEPYISLPSTSIQQLTISPDNNYIFIAMGTGGTEVVPFTATTSNNAPFGAAIKNIPVKNSNSQGAALSVAVDPSNRLFYIGETSAISATYSGGLRVFNYASLPTISELSASPYASQGLSPYSIVPISTGNYVYVANHVVSGSIAGFSITGSSSTAYTLTPLDKTFTAGTYPKAMVEDSTDQFIFVVNYEGSYDLMGYTFDSTNAGYLDSVSAVSSSTGTDPVEASAIAAIHNCSGTSNCTTK
jgi:6-phosphogluconolactonase (cycloisomerase 2 family)